MLSHNYIGTEHILLGLIHEGDGVAAKTLESLGISLEAVRQQIEEIIGQGQQTPTGHIPFTPRAKVVLDLSRREAAHLGHDSIGTEHILLGLIREGEGVAAQVLVNLGAGMIMVRQQVIAVLSGKQPSRRSPPAAAPVTDVRARLGAIEGRLAAIEQRAGTGPDASDLTEQYQRLSAEVERLRVLLRQHGIDPQDKPA